MEKRARILTDSTSTMLFLTETTKEQNETQKHISVFRRTGSCPPTTSEYQINSHSRAILKSYACQGPNKGGIL